MKIIWSPLAIERAVEIAEYISKDNPLAAQNWIDKIFQKVAILKLSPELGRIVPELQRKKIRELISGNYRIIYQLTTTDISILTIRHGKQILPVEEVEDITGG